MHNQFTVPLLIGAMNAPDVPLADPHATLLAALREIASTDLEHGETIPEFAAPFATRQNNQNLPAAGASSGFQTGEDRGRYDHLDDIILGDRLAPDYRPFPISHHICPDWQNLEAYWDIARPEGVETILAETNETVNTGEVARG